MSRRIALVVLAASAALTATYAVADPECFADSCRLPAVVEPPPAAAAAPAPAASAPAPGVAVSPLQVPELAREALAQPAPRPTVYPREAARAPRPVRNPLGLSPSSDRPQLAAEPVAPVRDYEAPVMRTAEVLPAARQGGAVTARVEQGAIDTGPIYGVPYGPGPVVVGVPGVIYGGAAVRPVYLVAPSAKIIHIDRDE